MTIAATSLVGQSVGQDDSEGGKVFITQFFTLSIVSGVFFALVGYFMAPTIIGLMGGAEGDLFNYSVEYLQIIFLETPLLFLFHVYKSMREGTGDTKSPTIFLGVSVGLNMVLDPIFILVLGFGVKGAAIATVLSKALVVGFMLIKMFDKKELVHVDLKALKPNIKVLRNLLRVGLPASAGYTMTAIGFTIMHSFIVSYGDNTVAAFGLGNRITNIVMMPAFGLGAALAAFISQNIGGAGQFDRAKKSVFTTMGLGGVSMLAAGSYLIYTFRISLIHIFISEPEVVQLSQDYIVILALIFPLMAVLQTCLGGPFKVQDIPSMFCF